ncbi:hypothetical protein ABPG77_010587 [Micractinium sp. CCAP 211/92]
MIEEIDTSTYNKHFFEKVFREVGSDPEAFLAAALDFVKQESSFFSQPGAAAAVQRLAERCLPRGASEPGPGAATQPAPEAEQQQQQQQQQQAQPLAASEQPLSQQQAAAQQAEGEAAAGTKEADEAGPSTLQPNAGNGADMPGYSWTQTLAEVVLNVPVPPGTKGRGCDVAIGRDTLRVGLKGQPPVLDGPLFASVRPDECLWNLVDGKQLEVTLAKRDGMQWWRCVVAGQPEIDTQQVEPEASKLTDLGEWLGAMLCVGTERQGQKLGRPDLCARLLGCPDLGADCGGSPLSELLFGADGEMRATVEKMMYDQRQKAMGLPTSDEQRKSDILKQFMAAHPEMDFSNAKIEM